LTSLDRPKQVMSGNDWHFRAACAGFVKCAFKLVDGWENVQQEGEDALNDEEVSFYAGDVSSKISFEIKPVFFRSDQPR
jgi:hypothetical protein